jgi:hypothetical protein
MRNLTNHTTVQAGPPLIISCSVTQKNTWMDVSFQAAMNLVDISEWFEE